MGEVFNDTHCMRIDSVYVFASTGCGLLLLSMWRSALHLPSLYVRVFRHACCVSALYCINHALDPSAAEKQRLVCTYAVQDAQLARADKTKKVFGNM